MAQEIVRLLLPGNQRSVQDFTVSPSFPGLRRARLASAKHILFHFEVISRYKCTLTFDMYCACATPTCNHVTTPQLWNRLTDSRVCRATLQSKRTLSAAAGFYQSVFLVNVRCLCICCLKVGSHYGCIRSYAARMQPALRS